MLYLRTTVDRSSRDVWAEQVRVVSIALCLNANSAGTPVNTGFAITYPYNYMFYERMLIHASVRRVLGLFQVGLIGIKVLQAIAWGGETCKAFLRRSRASARSASKWKDQKTLRFLKGLALRHGLSPKLRAFDLPSLPMLLSCRPLFAI